MNKNQPATTENWKKDFRKKFFCKHWYEIGDTGKYDGYDWFLKTDDCVEDVMLEMEKYITQLLQAKEREVLVDLRKQFKLSIIENTKVDKNVSLLKVSNEFLKAIGYLKPQPQEGRKE